MNVLAVFVVLALIPGASALTVLEAELTAQRIVAPESAQLEADAALAHFHRSSGPGVPVRVDVTAHSGRLSIYRDDGHYVDAAGVPLVSTVRATRSVLGGNDEHHDVSQVSGSLVGTYAVLHAFGDMQVAVTAGPSTMSVLANPVLRPSGIGPAGPTNEGPLGGSEDPDEAYWTNRQASGDHGLMEAEGASQWRLAGDLVLEVYALAGTLAAAEGTYVVQTGQTSQRVGAGVSYVQESLARLILTDAVVVVTMTDGSFAQAALGQASITSALLRLDDANGRVTSLEGEATVANEEILLEGPHRVVAVPTEALGIHATGLDARGEPLTQSASTLGATPWIGLGAALLVIAALVAARHARRLPTLGDVEANIEAGRYARAAREAQRMLARNPENEDAFVSRVVALSKGHRYPRVIHEIEAHLRQRPPSDGVLHYVLGRAYEAVGDVAKARAAALEATRRSPQLGRAPDEGGHGYA